MLAADRRRKKPRELPRPDRDRTSTAPADGGDSTHVQGLGGMLAFAASMGAFGPGTPDGPAGG